MTTLNLNLNFNFGSGTINSGPCSSDDSSNASTVSTPSDSTPSDGKCPLGFSNSSNGTCPFGFSVPVSVPVQVPTPSEKSPAPATATGTGKTSFNVADLLSGIVGTDFPVDSLMKFVSSVTSSDGKSDVGTNFPTESIMKFVASMASSDVSKDGKSNFGIVDGLSLLSNLIPSTPKAASSSTTPSVTSKPATPVSMNIGNITDVLSNLKGLSSEFSDITNHFTSESSQEGPKKSVETCNPFTASVGSYASTAPWTKPPTTTAPSDTEMSVARKIAKSVVVSMFDLGHLKNFGSQLRGILPFSTNPEIISSYLEEFISRLLTTFVEDNFVNSITASSVLEGFQETTKFIKDSIDLFDSCELKDKYAEHLKVFTEILEGLSAFTDDLAKDYALRVTVTYSIRSSVRKIINMIMSENTYSWEPFLGFLIKDVDHPKLQAVSEAYDKLIALDWVTPLIGDLRDIGLLWSPVESEDFEERQCSDDCPFGGLTHQHLISKKTGEPRTKVQVRAETHDVACPSSIQPCDCIYCPCTCSEASSSTCGEASSSVQTSAVEQPCVCECGDSACGQPRDEQSEDSEEMLEGVIRELESDSSSETMSDSDDDVTPSKKHKKFCGLAKILSEGNSEDIARAAESIANSFASMGLYTMDSSSD